MDWCKDLIVLVHHLSYWLSGKTLISISEEQEFEYFILKSSGAMELGRKNSNEVIFKSQKI